MKYIVFPIFLALCVMVAKEIGDGIYDRMYVLPQVTKYQSDQSIVRKSRHRERDGCSTSGAFDAPCHEPLKAIGWD
ncbi:MAG: hypothetical protein MN733_19770 [Nitrososphaera sp.]|nr:hypothetical protein [Nitrososphaera sp.]